jgi:hypothetical protein
MTDPSDIGLQFHRDPPLSHWPAEGNPGGVLSFDTGAALRDFIAGLGIHPRIPHIVRLKVDRAQRRYLFGWIDFSLVKAGEFAALIAVPQHGRPLSAKERRSSLTISVTGSGRELPEPDCLQLGVGI